MSDEGLADVGTARIRAQHYESHRAENPHRYDHVGFAGGSVVVGTVLGKHTVAETRDLLRAVEFRVNKVRQQLGKVQSLRRGAPSGEQAALDADMTTFLSRWADVRDRQVLLLAASLASNPHISAALLPAETNFAAIEKATRIDLPRLSDLQNRTDAEARTVVLPPIDLSAVPAQDSPDADFATLHVLDAAIGTGEGAFHALVDAPKEKVKSWFSIPWWGYGLGVVVLGGIGYSFYRAAKQAKAQALWGGQMLAKHALPGAQTETMPLFQHDPRTGVFLPVSMQGVPVAPLPSPPPPQVVITP